MFRVSHCLFKRPFQVHRRSANLPHFDVCVIGGGPAGFAAALRAVDYNKRVCLVEMKQLGGADLWDGALQSKTLWEMSRFVAQLRGTTAARLFDPMLFCNVHEKLSDERIMSTLQQVSEKREKQMKLALQTAGVTVITGKAMFASPNEVDVHSIGTGEYQTLSSDYFVMATGSSPRPHPHFPIDRRRVVTSDEMMHMPIPRSMVIIGAGVVGCEFASIYAHFGKTKVFLIDKAPRILPMEDEDIALKVQDLLIARGVTIHHDSVLFDLQAWEESETEGGCQYTIQYKGTNKLESYEVERALVSIGREANYEGLGLENTKCKVTDGKINIDRYNRCTPHQHIYAVGDASACAALVNTGEHQARAAVDHMYNTHREKTVTPSDLSDVSTIMFLDEAVAAVGLNEQQCRKNNVAYVVARYGYQFVSRALAMGDSSGFCKLIVTNDAERRVLGVRAIGPHSSSLVEVVSLAIRRKQSAYDLLDLTIAYPTVVQGLVECVRMVLGCSILKPNVFPDAILRSWEPPSFVRGRAYQQEELRRERSAAESTDVLLELREQHQATLQDARKRGEKAGRALAISEEDASDGAGKKENCTTA